jgi:hypothetical protein
MAAILGDPPDGEDVPYIDSRLHVVHCSIIDITDSCDEVLRQKRLELRVRDTDALAVLLYRLYELDNEDAESLFIALCSVFLDTEECWVELRDCQSCVWPHVYLDGVPFGQLNTFVHETCWHTA